MCRHSVIRLLLLSYALCVLSNVMACPMSCGCIWKGGKQTAECINKSMNDIPDGIDTGTQVLDFSGNNLKNLSTERFQRIALVNLQKIFLSRCRISYIDDRAFRGLSNLVELDLSHNSISSVPSVTFPDYPTLMKLSLNGNPIRVLKTSSFHTLRYLVSLELSKCQLEIIEADAFSGLNSLEWLKLEHNSLKYVPGPNTLPKQLHGIDMQHNPWFCDCLLLDTYRWLNNVKIPEASEPMCDGPQRLRGAPIKLLDENELACLPDVTPTSLYLEISEGKNVSLLCRVHAVPEAKVSWWFKDRVLQNDSVVAPGLHLYYYLEEGAIDKKSELFIYNTNLNDNGTFICQAENQAGKFRSNYTIRIVLKEERPVEINRLQFEAIFAAYVAAALISVIALSICLVMFLIRCRGKKRRLLKKKEKTKELALYGDGVLVAGENQFAVVGCASDLADAKFNNGGVCFQGNPNNTRMPEQTSTLLTYPSYSVVPSATEQNPDLISDTEKDRSNSQSGDEVVVCSNNNKEEMSPPLRKVDSKSCYHHQAEEMVTGSPPLIVCINHHLQQSADVHLVPTPPIENYYPLDYGLPRLQTQEVPFYRTLPHRRHTSNNQCSSFRYAREAEFTPRLIHQPASYEHYRGPPPPDIRYNVQGYPTESISYPHYPKVTFSDTVCILDESNRHIEMVGNVCKGVQVNQGLVECVSLVNASAQTINEELNFPKDPILPAEHETPSEDTDRTVIKSATGTQGRLSSNRNVLPLTDSPDEGYVGESADNNDI